MPRVYVPASWLRMSVRVLAGGGPALHGGLACVPQIAMSILVASLLTLVPAFKRHFAYTYW